jgi:hypothetical protein
MRGSGLKLSMIFQPEKRPQTHGDRPPRSGKESGSHDVYRTAEICIFELQIGELDAFQAR